MKGVLILTLIAAGCSSDPTPAPDLGTVQVDQGAADVGSAVDLGRDVSEPDAALPDVLLDAAAYCESTAEFFCDYYLRCGRIAATDDVDCQQQFAETCNAAYEPQYRALVDQGHLALSQAGMSACAAHLGSVSCDRQVFDLDGACGQMWRGLAGSGDACAAGIGSFVCGPSTECVLDLSLCGTCQPAGEVGEPCIEDRCVASATCQSGVCAARGLPGDACNDDRPCILGASCGAGVCERAAVVMVGEACDQGRRCPYQSTCLGAVCVQDALLGESCSDAACASGWCDGTICRAFATPGTACAETFQCLGAACEGTCGEPISECFQ